MTKDSSHGHKTRFQTLPGLDAGRKSGRSAGHEKDCQTANQGPSEVCCCFSVCTFLFAPPTLTCFHGQTVHFSCCFSSSITACCPLQEGERRVTPLHLLAELADPSDYSIHGTNSSSLHSLLSTAPASTLYRSRRAQRSCILYASVCGGRWDDTVDVYHPVCPRCDHHSI
jgi:hypothetical protein